MNIKLDPEELDIILTYLEHGHLTLLKQYGPTQRERIRRIKIKKALIQRLKKEVIK